MRRKHFSLLLALAWGLLSTGCEDIEKDKKQNGGQGVDNFYVSIGRGHMFRGDKAEKTARVKKGENYTVKLRCSNDGDSDAVSVFVNQQRVGVYRSPVVRHGGHGWYEPFFSQPYTFSTTNSTITLGVKVDSADSWGVWPLDFWVDKAKK